MTQRLLALKIDVDTYRGTLIGVPRLVEMLRRHGADATFLFSLGRDHTGRALRRAFRPGFMKKVSRTSVLSHYGLKTLLYGVALPGPDIGCGCADILRGVRDSGFETGIHCWDHVKWQDHVRHADMAWTEREMELATSRYANVFGSAATVHGAAGWQMNAHALRLTQRLGFSHASDCRGSHPFIPVWDAEIVNCPQLPTTLPTLSTRWSIAYSLPQRTVSAGRATGWTWPDTPKTKPIRSSPASIPKAGATAIGW